jgi:hypothetical protein
MVVSLENIPPNDSLSGDVPPIINSGLRPSSLTMRIAREFSRTTSLARSNDLFSDHNFEIPLNLSAAAVNKGKFITINGDGNATSKIILFYF